MRFISYIHLGAVTAGFGGGGSWLCPNLHPSIEGSETIGGNERGSSTGAVFFGREMRLGLNRNSA